MEARLFSHRDVDGDTAEVLAGAVASPAEGIPLGRCALALPDVVQGEALSGTSPDATVTLLDAGELVARAGGRTVSLAPRSVPGIVPFVTGVAYQPEDADLGLGGPLELTVGGSAFVSAFGGDDVGAFSASTAMPTPPRLITLAGSEPADDMEISRAASLKLHWVPAGGAEPVLVTVAWRDGRGGALRCRVADLGGFELPGGLLEEMPVPVAAELSVWRMSRAGFDARGLDRGELEVAVGDVVRVRFY